MIEKVTIPAKKGIRLACQKCGNIWVYCGKKQTFCTCSKCRTTVSIKNNFSSSSNKQKKGKKRNE